MTEYPWSETTSYLDYAVIPILAAGDLFFTGIGDTITLPYTAVEEARRAFRRPDTSANFVPVAAPEPVATPERVSTTQPPPRLAPVSHVGR